MKIQQLLEGRIPEEFIVYCTDLHQKYPFDFKITRKRVTKAGDYRYSANDPRHRITVNSDLNQWSFLITYLHEVAHRIVKSEYKRTNKPHGPEWKRQFRQLLLPVFELAESMPKEMETALADYARNPAASTYSNSRLLQALRKFDGDTSITLNELSEGQTFVFRKKKYYKREKRRTRHLCQEMGTGRKYLINGTVAIEKFDN